MKVVKYWKKYKNMFDNNQLQLSFILIEWKHIISDLQCCVFAWRKNKRIKSIKSVLSFQQASDKRQKTDDLLGAVTTTVQCLFFLLIEASWSGKSDFKLVKSKPEAS